MPILVKHDPTIVLPEINVPMEAVSSEEDPDLGKNSPQQQTKMTGITAPLIRVGKMVINWTQVSSFTLRADPLPRVQLSFSDDIGFFDSYGQPGADNSLQVQILPPFDNAYKKINMMFYMEDVYKSGGDVVINARAHTQGLAQSSMKAYGKISSYKFFEQVAAELEYGFASNVDDTEDERWIYNPNTPREELLDKEVCFAGTPEHIFDWWVDYWNYVNLVDIKERFESIDKTEDMMIWVDPFRTPKTDTDEDVVPEQVEALITNHPGFRANSLYCGTYEQVTDVGGNVRKGTDKLVETFNMDESKCDTLFLQDGDVQNDEFFRYIYGGENFGEHKYLNQKRIRELYRQKMSAQSIEVTLNKPQLSLIRGGKVNFMWYDCNEWLDNREEVSLPSNIPLDEVEDEDTAASSDNYVLNHKVSGQYLINDMILEYGTDGGREWRQTLKLVRPADQIFTHDDITKAEEEKNK